MKKLKVAIVGCGRVSACYEYSFKELSNMLELVYAVDVDENKAMEFAEKFNCSYTTNFEELLDKDIDVIHLCTPHYLHASQTIKALEAGKNVLTEKPMAITLQDADEMIKAEACTGKKLGVIFQTRYTNSCDKIKAIIDSGELGKIIGARSYLTWTRPDSYYLDSDWKGTWDKEGGGVLIDQAIHSIDRVRYLIGDEVEWIKGSIGNWSHEYVKVEDTASAIIKFQGGCLYNLYASNTYVADSPINIEIIGEKGRVGLLQDMGFVDIDGKYSEIRNTYEDVFVGPTYWGSSHHIQLRDYYESILMDTAVKTNGIEGRKTLELIKGIYLSAIDNKRITLPFEDRKISL